MHDNKHITTGVGLVVWRGDEVLLIKRGKAPFKGEWSIPGGRLEPGEALQSAAQRELMEETGTTARIISLLDVYESITETAHYIMIDYVGEWTSGEPVAGDDADDAAFFAYQDALDKVSWDTTRTALADAKALRERHKAAVNTN